MTRSESGCRDPSEPHGSAMIRAPFRIFFAKRASRWHGGGVCFLGNRKIKVHATTRLLETDSSRPKRESGSGAVPSPVFPVMLDLGDPAVTGGEFGCSESILRAYDVSLPQFNDIVAQENGVNPKDSESDSRSSASIASAPRALTSVDLARMRSGGPGSRIRLGTGWYGTAVYLGEAPMWLFEGSRAIGVTSAAKGGEGRRRAGESIDSESISGLCPALCLDMTSGLVRGSNRIELLPRHTSHAGDPVMCTADRDESRANRQGDSLLTIT